MQWLKLPSNQANQLRKIPEFEEVAGLKINKNNDSLDYLITRNIDGFIYVYMGIFDLKNKNRLSLSSLEEQGKWAKFIGKKWEVVDELPSTM